MGRKYLGAKDRRFIAEAYFGTIKNWRRLESLVQHCFDDKSVTSERLIAAYAILYKGTDPTTAQYIFGKYDLALTALECLADRTCETARLEPLPVAERLGVLYSFPEWFVHRVAEEYGPDRVEPILAALNEEAPTTVRTNTLLTSRDALQDELWSEGCKTSLSLISPEALVLERRVNVFSLPAFKRGAFEVQDEASQLIAPFAEIRKTAIKVLDTCAGAGGKTLHLSVLMKNRGEIFATDVDPRKLDALQQRASRSGAQNIRVVLPDDKEKAFSDKAAWFDLVLVDAPCTGTGTLRRNPGIKWLLTEQMIVELISKQRAILEENLHFVKRGGTLLYATCSLLREEGEDQVEWLTGKYPEFTLEEILRTRPDEKGCDGFFAARLRRKSEAL